MDTANAFCGFESARECCLCDDCSKALFKNDWNDIPDDTVECLEAVVERHRQDDLEYIPGHIWLDTDRSGTGCDCCGTTEYGWRSHTLEVPFEG